MSELFDQFLIEARELLDGVGAGLLRLERNLDDKATINELFRAFHTLKGATALFGWPAFTHLLHAAEDLLSSVRSGEVAPTPDLIDRLFAVADQSARWVHHIEAHRDLPAEAGEQARVLEERLRAVPDGPAGGGAPLPDDFAWLKDLTREEREALRAAGSALTAVAYDPDPECFFNGDDPLALCRRIPRLVLLRIEPVEPLPDLAALDPYRCLLRFRAVSAAPAADVSPVFRTAPDQVRLAPVPADLAGSAPAPAAPAPAQTATTMAEAILGEQRRILALEATPEEMEGRLASVERTAVNVLTALGRAGEVEAVRAAAASARAVGRPGPLANHIATLLAVVATEAVEAKLADAEPRAARRALRVEPERVDQLLALVGELAVAKNRLPPLVRQAEGDRGLARALREVADTIDGLSGELQNAVLRLRMLPLATVLQPLPRMVRDVAQRLGKRIELQVVGERTEADKDVLDVLGEPLIHLVRNAVDHGIETAERRAAVGKPEAGTIRIEAHQDKDSVVIEISDDGGGIDAAAVRRKAVENGVLDAERAAALSDAEALPLILLPGVSTAKAVTDLSGRGVGMDAVRSAVEMAGGRIEIASELGQGTRVRLILPLTMVITPVMVVEAADGLFGIPTATIVEVAKLPAQHISRVKHAESVVLRGQLIPVFRLRRLLALPEGEGDAGVVTVLVLRLDREPVGLLVDGIRDRMDAVLKPLSGVLATLRGYSGTAELADGRLLPVINLRELL